MAAHARAGQQVPNLFLAAVHFLLLRGEESPLRACYRSLCPDPLPPDDKTYPLFREFCLEHRREVEALIAERLVQTNEPKRSAALVLGLNEVIRSVPASRLALVEVGASAGLNLLYEQFSYDFRHGRTAGIAGSPIVIETQLSGEYNRTIQLRTIARKSGIDLNPIPADDPEARAWLRALIWPEHEERRRLQDAALEVARAHPPHLIAGDALELLPEVVGSLPLDASVCVFHSAALAHFTQDGRTRFFALMEALAAQRETAWLSLEGPGLVRGPLQNASPSDGAALARLANAHRAFHVLGLTLFPWGERRERHDHLLAAVDGHGSWIEWLGEESLRA